MLEEEIFTVTTIKETRTERNSMGEMQVPINAYYGASTQRAVLNFPISDLRFPRQFIRALGQIKQAAAQVNEALGVVDPQIAEAIVRAAQEVVDGKLDSDFVLDIFQTGSGTSTNMNANEVIANRASELLGRFSWFAQGSPQRSCEFWAIVERCHSNGDASFSSGEH